jgi:hypothetical protein
VILTSLWLLVLLAGGALAVAQPETPPVLSQPWQALYTGDYVSGPQVLGCWQFDAGAELKDSSRHGNHLELKGAALTPNGRFGGGLESFKGFPVEDKIQQAFAKPHASLSPKGAFTIEAWIQLKPDLGDYGQAFIVDKKYASHQDYQLILGTPDRQGKRRLVANLGFGSESDSWSSDSGAWQPGTWYHVAFSYDAAGTGRFFRDGRAFGNTTRDGRGKIAPGTHGLAIGDRIGSRNYGFPGYLDQVRLSEGALDFRPAAFQRLTDRSTFVRLEPKVNLRFAVTNLLPAPLTGARAQIGLVGETPSTVNLPTLAPGASHELAYPLNTKLRPATYEVSASVLIPGDKPYFSTERFPVVIVPRLLPQQMPVVMWGGGYQYLSQLKDLGFTHFAGGSADFNAIFASETPIPASNPQAVATMRQNLDKALAAGLHVYVGLSPGRWARDQQDYKRIGRDGKPYAHADVCGLFPRIRQFCYNTGAAIAKSYGDMPALDACLVHTEVRSEGAPCFHPHDLEALKKAEGIEVPAEAKTIYGLKYNTLKDFPADRIIPDNYPLYRYFRWLWKEGDGWNALHTAVHEGFKSAGRPDLWTWHDPAARVASVWGSGGDVDYLAHWTYSYPDPIRIGLCTDELFAMAEGGKSGQQVMKMTQIIWYRSQTAPEPGEQAQVVTGTFIDQDTGPQGRQGQKAEGYQADWEIEQPDARFITIAPHHLREALWTKLSRPIQGIQYHGWQSLVATEDMGYYRYTHHDTKDELRRLVKSVVEPLGPTLRQVPDRRSDVAFLESLASQMLARRGTYGWNGGWQGDAYLILAYAQLQPEVVYDETIMKRGLQGYKVLVLTDCDVLTQGVADRIKAFQKQGGIVVGDENLAPGITPDILLPSHTRPKEAHLGRALLQEKAAALRRDLDAHYTRYLASTNPDVVTRARRYQTTDYLFAINDRREYGDYVGHHKLVMENGLPSDTELILNRRSGHVYDLVAHQPVATTASGRQMRLKLSLGPCEGRLLMVTDRPVEQVRLTAPATVRRGEQATVRVAVTDAAGKPVEAVVPVQITLADPSAREAEFSGYYGARDGQVQVDFLIAPNDRPGLWHLQVKELASGKVAHAFLRVGDK